MSTFVSQFKTQAIEKSGDLRLRQFIRTSLRGYEIARDRRKGAFQSWESARQAAAETKWEAVNHLDTHLESLVAKLEARGTKVHWASTGEQAREIIAQILRDKKARCIIKSKAMTSEEIHLNDALEKVTISKLTLAPRPCVAMTILRSWKWSKRPSLNLARSHSINFATLPFQGKDKKVPTEVTGF